jgi:heat shock protein HslJ
MRAFVTCLLFGAALSSGCESEPSPSPPPAASEQAAGDLWGRAFSSTTATENGEPRPLLPDTRIEITFEKREDYGVVRWQAGCNTIGADVEITADQLLLVRTPLSTAIGCSGSHHAQDRWLTRFFESDPRWQLSDGRLSLASGETAIDLAAERIVRIAPEDVERANGLKGTLVAIPRHATAGSEMAVAVRNTGTRQMAFGLGFRVEHRDGGKWIDVTRKAIGRGFVRAIGLYAPAGETTGPRYGSVRDAFIIRPTLKPGRYRAIKSVGRSLGAGGGRSLRLDADFAIGPREASG